MNLHFECVPHALGSLSLFYPVSHIGTKEIILIQFLGKFHFYPRPSENAKIFTTKSQTHFYQI